VTPLQHSTSIMSDIRKVGPPLGLQAVNDSMSADERCAIGVSNIELLLDLEWRSNLLLGAELSRMKWSGDFTRDTVWTDEDKARGWPEWLKRRGFRLNGSDAAMNDTTANTLIMWSVLYACFADENQRRAERGQLPLPLPTSVSQLRPYASLMRRVDDWQLPALDRSHPSDHAGAFEMEPPFAADQAEVIAAWEAAWETIPPEKRIRKGEPVPPSEPVSRQYFAEREGLKQLKQREERELEEARRPALTVGAKPASAERQQAAAAPPPRTERKPAPPKKTEAEIKAERRAYQVQQDARDYRLKLMNLQQSAESLRAFLKNVLSREGSEAYLTELRNVEAGIYSVDKDVELLRGAVVTLQEAFKLATEPYTPPAPMPRSQEVASDVVIDVEVEQ
jgi:hypothetical protein